MHTYNIKYQPAFCKHKEFCTLLLFNLADYTATKPNQIQEKNEKKNLTNMFRILETANTKLQIESDTSYLPNPSARAGYDTRSVFKRSLAGLNSEFSFS